MGHLRPADPGRDAVSHQLLAVGLVIGGIALATIPLDAARPFRTSRTALAREAAGDRH